MDKVIREIENEITFYEVFAGAYRKRIKLLNGALSQAQAAQKVIEAVGEVTNEQYHRYLDGSPEFHMRLIQLQNAYAEYMKQCVVNKEG